MEALDAFREETRTWLLANAPKSMSAPFRSLDELCWGGKKSQYDADTRRWLDLMAERGWTAPSWPQAYGGGGLSKAEAKVLGAEMARLHLRPPLVGFGLTMIGPLLLQAGSEELKRIHLPRIVRGEVRWCQGYSEPGAGSDLASLQTRALLEGDDFVISGQKIWTSYADKADWMFLLVRTDPEARKQHGITFLLMDMDTPGVSVKPIRLISGSSPFCETFLDNVRVPRSQVVGQINGGWEMAKALLGHERTMIAGMFKDPTAGNPLLDLARKFIPGSGQRIADSLLRDRIIQVEMDEACLGLTLKRSEDNMKAGHKPGPETSIFKYYGTELNMRKRELMIAIAGLQALGWEGPGFDGSDLTLTRDWLRSRGNSIEGGTSEIQLNIIAKRVLGLPD